VPGLTPVRLDFEGKATIHPKKYLTTIEKGRHYDLIVSGRFGDQKAEAFCFFLQCQSMLCVRVTCTRSKLFFCPWILQKAYTLPPSIGPDFF
jgi:hypothetical protein